MAKTYTVAFGSGDPRSFTGLSPTLLIFVNASSGATLVAPSFSEALTGSGIYKFSYGTTTPIAFLADAATTSPGAVARYVIGQIDPADRSDEYGTTLVAIGTTLTGYGVSTLAFGVTSIAIGTSQIAQGVSILAFGSSLSAMGLTTLGYGVSIYAFDQAMGISVLSFGTSLVALGNTILASSGAAVTLTIDIGTTASPIGDNLTDPSTLFGYLKRINHTIQGQETFNKGSGSLVMYDRTGATTLASLSISNSATMVTRT